MKNVVELKYQMPHNSFFFVSISLIASTSLRAGEYDLDYGSKNGYVPADVGDGGQGQFGAVSPSNWRVPGTSPIGSTSWDGAADGGDEPWFAEAVSTVSLDLEKASETMLAFTKEAAQFKIAAFCEEKGIDDNPKKEKNPTSIHLYLRLGLFETKSLHS